MNQLTKVTDLITSLLIFGAVLTVLGFIGLKIFAMYQSLIANNLEELLHDMALVIVLIKAYRLLLFYLESHHVSIKFIIEISIIAPAVEIIFAVGNRPLEINILFGVFSFLNLLIYLLFYRRLRETDDKYCAEFKTHERY